MGKSSSKKKKIKFFNRTNNGDLHYIDIQRVPKGEDSIVEIFAEHPDTKILDKVGEYIFKDDEELPEPCPEGFHKDDQGNCIPDIPKCPQGQHWDPILEKCVPNEPGPDPEENRPPKIRLENADDDEQSLFLATVGEKLVIKTKITDDDGAVSSIIWSLVLPKPKSMPEQDGKEDIELTFDTEGDFVFSLTATDNLGLSTTKLINIKVRKKVVDPEPTPTEDFVTKLAFGADFDCGSITNKNIALLDKAEKVVVGGDYSYGSSLSCFAEPFNRVKDKLLVAVRGNHDDDEESGDGVNGEIKSYFGLPSVGFITSGVFENFVVIGLDSQADELEQLPFLEQILQENNNKLWKIVVIHKPIYSTGHKHGDQKSLRAPLQKILDKFGVDLVLQGHNHNAWITEPIFGGSVVNKSATNVYNFSKKDHGTIFVGNGNSGRKFYRNGSIPSFIRWENDSDFGVLYIEQDKNTEKRLRVRHISQQGATLNSFILDKTGVIVDPEPEPIECGENEHKNAQGNCVCNDGYRRDSSGKCVKIIEPEPIPDGDIIFDSNKHWVGTTGQTVSGKFGNIGPNGKGFYTAASGSPKLHFVTPTEYILEGSGSGIHPRIYGAVCNYNARIECTFKFITDSVENITLKIRNRHGMGGDCENRVGGFGCHIARNEAGMKIEKCHNIHESGKDFSLPKNLVTGQWYRMAFTVKDIEGEGIFQELELDYLDGEGFIKIGRTMYTGSYAPYFNKALFDQHSEFWIRYNGNSGKVGFKDVILRKV